ncbi:MAG TPA: DUF2442 domain-containing protein [Rhodothermales bacterium]|nr:DUF2442 domain-containing protein [Rhodothermales bacterium]
MLHTPQIIEVEPREDFTLLLTFTNGEQRVFDMRPELETVVFSPLRDLSLFKQVKVVFGCLEWPGERDLAYDMLYVQSEPVPMGAG